MSANKNRIIGGASTILHSLTVPIFSLFFIIFYKPRGIYEMLNMEHASFTFNVTILFCIILVSISITRGWLYLIGRQREISRQMYAAWCACETVIAALFSALYTTLMLKEPVPFYETAGSMIVLLATASIYPYLFLWLEFELHSRSREKEEMPDEKSLLRFYDEYKKLRFVIASEAVIFIKSEENYVHIYYQDQGKSKKFTLRSSMKALESTLSKHGLVRCHRSYFINPEYIKIIHRNSSGIIVAELKQEHFESIPISRKYHDEITKLL